MIPARPVARHPELDASRRSWWRRTGLWPPDGGLVPALCVSAALALLLRVLQGSRAGYDLAVVYDAGRHLLHGQPVYADPLFLYLPSSALLAAPFGLLGPPTAMALGAVLAGLALVCLCLGSTRLLAPAAAPWVGPAALLLVLTSVVGGALMDGLNLEFLLLAALPLLHRWAADGRWVPFAVLLGGTFAVKPILVALLLLPLLARQWHALVVAVAVPAVLSAAGLALMPDRGTLLPTVLAHLAGPSQPAFAGTDVSLVGVFRSFGVFGTPVAVARVAVVVVGVGAAVLRWRRGGNPVLRTVEVGTLAVLTSVSAASLAWQHYSLFAVPALVLAVHPASLARRAWLVWPCLLPLVVVLLPLPAQPVARWDVGARAGLSILGVLLLLSATVVLDAWRSGRDPITATTSPAPTG